MSLSSASNVPQALPSRLYLMELPDRLSSDEIKALLRKISD